MKRTFVAAILFSVLVIASASAQVTSGTRSLAFTITKAQCSLLPADVTGVIEISFVFRVSVVNGIRHVFETDVVRGTATDTLGNEYVIIDQDTFHSAVISQTAPTLTQTLLEHFILKPAGGGAPVLNLLDTLHVTIVNGNLAVFFDNVRPAGADGCTVAP